MLTSPQLAANDVGSFLPPSCLSVDEPTWSEQAGESPAWSPARWRQSKQVTLARRVSMLDRFLGHPVTCVADLRVVQSVILSRQDCARRAYEAGRQRTSGRASWRLPDYLANPVGTLAWWPFQHPDAPGECEIEDDGGW